MCLAIVLQRGVDGARRQVRQRRKVECVRPLKTDLLLVHHLVAQGVERAPVRLGYAACDGQQGRTAQAGGRRPGDGGQGRDGHTGGEKMAFVHAPLFLTENR
ncbi:hypothetical protein [Janthinobacterium sp. LB3P118]|uniref:hypothetical protein n=1 Tax=Janthinobacterium sp. LB3P118 TaxID=3424195 RepID=UPI003F224392